MASRVASSLLHAVGLDELITSTALDYEELAFQLAQDSDRLYHMRRHLEDVKYSSPVFDTKRWVQNLEKGMLQVWQNYESGISLEDVTIEDRGVE
jgi:protein O-GlcNAc transferase